ncbi:nucleolar protein 6-like isoform X2 [Littorina saxatilis]|uniref:nucleolar protein 6-like isoform X2 n=1 Tax=Littorina saxatilis TaxID=31220 RepID=UPI0038B4A9D1
MGIPDDMEDQCLSKKRPIAEDADQEKKAKKKKSTKGDPEMEMDRAVLAGDIPSLFNMQIEELLKETRMKRKRAEKLAETVEMLKDLLLNMSSGKEHKIHMQKWLKDIQLPVVQEPRTTKGCFQFHAPTRVFLGGSTPLNTCVQPSKAADLFMEMPKVCFQSKDCFNHRYTRKRALYLAAVALKLSKAKVMEDAKFTYHLGNPYRPILVLSVPGKGKPLTIHLHAVLEEGVFKPSRFHITKNNVRPHWFCGEERDDPDAGNEDANSLPSTPVYNTSILQDVCYDANAEFLSQQLQDAPSVRDAIALLKIWLHQRELDVGYGCFSGFLMSMLVGHLLSTGVVIRSMNSYQIFRNTLLHLSKSCWLEQPVTLCPEVGEGNRPTLVQFLQEFDVVFVDVTGYLNLCLGMTKSVYNRVCHEASLAIGCLMGDAAQHFDHLFMVPCCFQFKFDYTFTISLTPESLNKMVENFQLSDRSLDHSGDLVTTVLPSILEVLEKGLGDRVILIQPQPQPSPVWPLTEDPPTQVSDCSLTFGLLTHKSNSLRLLDRGPPANAPEAADFRQFWGEKSELRRFKDGGISEAVVWAFSSGLNQKRSVCSKIVTHVLTRHAGISSEEIHTVGRQLENILYVPRRIVRETSDISSSSNSNSKDKKKEGSSGAGYGTGEEHIYHIRQVLEDLGKALRKLPDLALRINAVTGVDAAFRFSEVFPALPAVEKLTSENLLKEKNRPLPLYTPAMTVICSLEGSGHWPEDIDRIRDLKTLYLVDLGDKLSDLGLKVNVQETHVDVLKDGYVFRLKLGVSREVGVLRMVRSPEGMLKMEDTPESLAVEAEITMLPEMTTTLQGVQQNHPSFCATVRLAKRWLSAQLLLGHIPDLVVERSVVHLFQNPLPFTAPVSPLVGFLRFLKLVSGNDYKVESFLDKVTAPPLPVIMNRLKAVAAQTLTVLQSQPDTQWKVIFRPPLNMYDVVIHLSTQWLSRGHQGVEVKDVCVAKYPEPWRAPANAVKEETLPVTDFDPAHILLQNLKSVYGDFALFFHDTYGGDVMSVLLKPGVTDPKAVELGHLFGQKPTVVDSKPALTFDLDAMVEAVKVIGGDMVVKVDVQTKIQS